jgi:corrinoid protein of di/trimethylamine methyltransferase
MSDKPLERLQQAILTYQDEAAQKEARRAFEEGIDPTQVATAVTDAIRQVGDAFGDGEIFLPELLSAAKATKAAMGIVEERLKAAGKEREKDGVLVIGTVQGDVHDIGKNIVAALFFASGFEVIDLGADISPEAFVKAVQEHRPDLLAMSALLTTTATMQKTVIEQLTAAGVRDQVKIIIGGAAISQGFADQIGADGYGATAFEGIHLAYRLLKAG